MFKSLSATSGTVIAKSVAFRGIEANGIEVQVLIAPGLPTFSIVGLPNKAVAESRERIRAAFYSIGIALPAKRITVNLAPADIQKEGSHYDLPISLALMCSIGVMPPDCLDGYVALGELGLDGSIASVGGVLPAAIYASSIDHGIICPESQGSEAMWGRGDLTVIAAPSLIALVNHLNGNDALPAPERKIAKLGYSKLDMTEVRGQQAAKRALEIAAAGRHNIALIGAPGAGKSMLAARLPSILPPLSPKEALEITMVQSLARQLPHDTLVSKRPFRAPHHSASLVAMTGGGTKVLPGELSLAHCGVLFLDELPEFNQQALEALRQPIEDGKITIARANAHVTYPANFQLITAMNPCRCGYLADPTRACSRAPRCAQDYLKKISGPLIDRLDMIIEVSPITASEAFSQQRGESSETIRARVINAQTFAWTRTQKNPETSHQGGKIHFPPRQIDLPIEARNSTDEAIETLSAIADRLNMTARGITQTLRLARTIADLAAKITIDKNHVTEAIAYRRSSLFKATSI